MRQQRTGYAVTATLNDAGAVRDFVLDGNGLVTGTVTTSGSGAPVPETLVIATDARGQVVGRVQADADGAFRRTGLPSGSITVAASAADHEPSAVTPTVEPGARSAAGPVLPSSSGLLAGVVTGPDGAGLVGATVTALNGSGEVVGTVTTDAAGSYAFLGIPAGNHTVVAEMFAPVTTSVEIAAGEAAQKDLRMGLAHSRSAT